MSAFAHWRFRGLFRSRVKGRVFWTVTYIDSDGDFSETEDASSVESALSSFLVAMDRLASSWGRADAEA